MADLYQFDWHFSYVCERDMLFSRMRYINWPQWTILSIGLLLTVVLSNIRWSKETYWKNTIQTDGKGYYAYLPAVFIYNDLNFGFYDSLDMGKYKDPQTFYDYRVLYKSQTINKYYCGTAILQMPFFLLGHGITYWTGEDMDGYSKWYQIFIGIGAVFWLLIGLLYLNRLLVLYTIRPLYRAMVLLVCVFGTHVYYYALIEPAMSHIYSFALVAAFLFYAKRYFVDDKISFLPLLGFVLGLIVLIRPVNGLVVLTVPFLAEDIFTLKRGIRRAIKAYNMLALSFLLFFFLVFIQLMVYKIAVGEFFIYAYKQEGFDFTNPHVMDILFSYKKGLFLYTPILFVSLVGLYFISKSSPYQAWAWLLFFVVITYVLSSWWIWYYGGSFSGRVFVEYVPFFMLPLAVAIQAIQHGLKKGVFIGVLFLLTALCQIQTYQYRYYQIHWTDMDKEKYWDVFLRVDKL